MLPIRYGSPVPTSLHVGFMSFFDYPTTGDEEVDEEEEYLLPGRSRRQLQCNTAGGPSCSDPLGSHDVEGGQTEL